jgi:hypothetical protein
MGQKVCMFTPGESETDDIVRRWLARQGIDQNLVSGYSIFRHQGELPRIMVEMHFDDSQEALADFDVSYETRDVSRETSAHDGPAKAGDRQVIAGKEFVAVAGADGWVSWEPVSETAHDGPAASGRDMRIPPGDGDFYTPKKGD